MKEFYQRNTPFTSVIVKLTLRYEADAERSMHFLIPLCCFCELYERFQHRFRQKSFHAIALLLQACALWLKVMSDKTC